MRPRAIYYHVYLNIKSKYVGLYTMPTDRQLVTLSAGLDLVLGSLVDFQYLPVSLDSHMSLISLFLNV